MTSKFLHTISAILFFLTVCEPIFAKISIPLIGASNSLDAAILLDDSTSSVIRYAVQDFNKDCEKSTQRNLRLVSKPWEAHQSVLLIPAVVGKNKWLDSLQSCGKIDIQNLKGKWESFIIQPVKNPFPGVKAALVVAGSDPRGVMYGIYEISERIFKSDPQKYWTDAIPKQVKFANWNFGTVTQGPPTFKFRGWFVNDEHGLLGWHHKEGEGNRIEPDEWAAIFESICRLRGNFYTLIEYGQTPDDASLKLANDRGLYVTGSHMHMLISNTSYDWNTYCENKYGHTLPYQWMSHSKEIASFWEDNGVKKHKDHLAIWTLGLKGAGDTDFNEGDPQAPTTVEGQAQVTNQAVQLQKEIVRRNLAPGADPLYMIALRGGLFDQYMTGKIHLPVNTMILWPDDPSFGCIRKLPIEADSVKMPNHGIFYHLTYCDNHWVEWFPLKNVQEQLVKAVNANAVSMAEFNVGDIREIPLKIAMAMDFTWNARPWLDDPNYWRKFTNDWVHRQFEPKDVDRITNLLVRYWDLEMPVRSMIILERLSQYTILDQSILKAIANKPDKKTAMVEYVRQIQVPTGDRYGKLGRDFLLQNAPNWNILWIDANNAKKVVPERRQQFYQDFFLLQVATSRLMNLWGGEIFLAFDDIKSEKFAEAADHFEKASKYITELAEQRKLSEHGKWNNWFNGDQLSPWTNNMWGFHDQKELVAEKELITLLRSPKFN
jgi:hypothetical protein